MFGEACTNEVATLAGRIFLLIGVIEKEGQHYLLTLLGFLFNMST